MRVPAFAVDMSGGKYLGQMGRRFEGMVHIRYRLLQTNLRLDNWIYSTMHCVRKILQTV